MKKIVAQKLQERGIEVYCPMIKTKRKWSDRIKTVEEPLFRSYCFINIEEQQRSQVFNVKGIVRYLFWLNKPAIVRDKEIIAVKQLLAEVDHNNIQTASFKPNNRVEITSGYLAHIEGNVVRQQGKLLTLVLDSLKIIVQVDLSKNSISDKSQE